MDYNEEYYAHNIGILLQTILKETGNKVSVQEAWDNYMFYPIEESHAKQYLTNYKITYFKDKAATFTKIGGD